MSLIRTSINVNHVSSDSLTSNNSSTTAFDDSFENRSKEITSTEILLTPVDIIAPKTYFIRNLSGDDVLISPDNKVSYPIAVPAGEATLFSLDILGKSETSTVIALLDSYADLSAKYFILYDQVGTVWVWFNTGLFATETLTLDTMPTDGDTMLIGARTYTWQTTLTNSNGNIWIGANLAASKLNLGYAIAASGGTAGTDYAAAMVANTEVKIDAFATHDALFTALAVGTAGNSIATTETFAAVTNVFGGATLSGGAADSTQPAGAPNRYLEVAIVPNATAIVNAVAIAAALEADAEFIAPVPTTSLVTVTDQQVGTRTDIAAGTSGMTVAKTVDGGALPIVWAKSKGTSQAQIVVVPS